MSSLKISLLLSYICIATFSAAIITPALPQIQAFYHLTHSALTWVISIFLLGYVAGQLIYAPIANRYGRLFALRAGLFVNLMGILLSIIAVHVKNYDLLLIGRLITALGAAAGLTCTFILIKESLNTTQVKSAMSYAVVSFTLGTGFAVAIGGFLTSYLNWTLCFYVLFIHGILMLLMTSQFKETLKKAININIQNILTGYKTALNIKLITFSLTLGIVSAFTYTFSAAAPIYAQKILALTPSTYSYWNFINMLGMLLSGFFSAKLLTIIKPQTLLMLAMGYLIPCFVSLFQLSHALHPNAFWFFTTTAFMYLLTGLIFPAASYFALNSVEDKASSSSLMSFINMGSATLAVVLMGYLPLQIIHAFNLTLVIFFIICSSLLLINLQALRKMY